VPPQARVVPTQERVVPTLWNKSSKRVAGIAHGRATDSTCRAKLLTWSCCFKLGGVATPLSSAAMLDIFAQDLHIFLFNQLQIML